ncbi:signal peptide peptidase SppA [Aurantivibrio plasticivorans]
MSDARPGLVKQIFSGIGKTISWTRVIVINSVFLILLIVIASSLFGPGLKPLPERAPLKINISGFLVDQKSYIDPITQLMGQGQGPAETLVRDVTRSIHAATNDPRVSKLIIDLQYFAGGGISKLEEIGQALDKFKTSGKEVIAVSDFYTQNHYYLASYADQVYLHPMGSVMLTGYGSYRNYYKDALDKLSVNMHVFRVGEYKDAVEPFLRSDMSEESREHNSQWINQLWSVYTSRVESLRQLPAGAINDYINNFTEHLKSVDGDAAQLALNTRLVDQLASRAELRRKFIQEFGEGDDDDYLAIDFQHYVAHLNRETIKAPDRVGLIVASGTIYDGQQPPGSIGGDSLADLFRQARDDDSIKAVVLRIDSGGGSAFASEVIRNEIVATQAAGKPIVVSMGSVAASGGYWIAANADEIWATPTTITGSIGVFAIFPTLETSLEKIGVTTDGIGTTELSGAMRIDMPVSPAAAGVLQAQVDNIYRRFINLVAEGRNTHPDLIHPIAQGRVWSGSSAQDFGLVDQLGYLDDAIASAAKRANLDTFTIELIDVKLSPFEQLIQDMSANTSAIMSKVGIGYRDRSGTQLLRTVAENQYKAVTDFSNLITTMRNPHDALAHCTHCLVPQ